jgi:glycosyltransferase involved in cell wall biosynthesis
VIPRTDALVANGPSYEAFLRAEFKHDNIHVMPNPVADAQVPATMSDYAGRERVVFFAGFLGRRKGVLELLQAAEKVPDARFIIYGKAGSAADEKEFQAAWDACQAKDRIDLDVGYGVDKVFKYMDQARLLALPSWGETMPLILEEAIVCGLPVVTTPVGVIADYVQDGVHGYLIEPGDVDALAAAINRILDDPQGAFEMSKHNRVFGQQFLSSAVHAKMFEMYDGILALDGAHPGGAVAGTAG